MAPSLEPVYDTNLVFNAPQLATVGTDAARGFHRGGQAPQNRIIAIPTLSGNTNNGGVTNETVNVTNSGSGGGGTTPTTVTAQVASLTTPSIAPGVPYTSTIAMAKTFALLRVSVSVPARVELYSTANFQALDIGRAAFNSDGSMNPPAVGTQHGVIADMYLDTVMTWVMSPAAEGANADFPQSALLYITITSLMGAGTVTATLLYVPQES